MPLSVTRNVCAGPGTASSGSAALAIWTETRGGTSGLRNLSALAIKLPKELLHLCAICLDYWYGLNLDVALGLFERHR